MMFIEKAHNFVPSGSILPELDAQREFLGINENIYDRSTGLTIEISNIELNQDTAAATGISDVMPPEVVASENSDKDPPPGQDITGMAPGSAIAFIDSAVENYQSLMAGITPEMEVIVLDSTMDGVTQITAALAKRENIGSVHILGHGSAGSMQLGNSILDSNTLGEWAPRLQQWSASLSSGADILLYGCNVGFGTEGVAFVNQLSQLTGADIAASNDLTGSSALGGDEDLEVRTGNIEASLAFEAGALAAMKSVLALIDNTTAQWTATTPFGNNNFYLNNNFSAAGNPLTGAIDGGPVEYRASDGVVVNSYNNFGDGAKSALELGSYIFFAGDSAQGIRRIDNNWSSNLTGYQATVEQTESITTDGTFIYGNDDVNRDRIIKWSVTNNASDFSLTQQWQQDVGSGGRFRGISYFDHSAAAGDEYIYASDGGAGGSSDKIWAFDDANSGLATAVNFGGSDITVPGTSLVYQAIVHEVGSRKLLMAVTADSLYVWDMASPTTTISATPTESYTLNASSGQLLDNGGSALSGENFYGAGARGSQLFLLHGSRVSAYQLSATALSTEVTNTNDSGSGSLRQALIHAAANPGADTITFTGATFTDAAADTITLTSGELTYLGGAGNDLTIQAPGNSRLTISGNNSSNVFTINSAANVTLDGLTIADGNNSEGGGIKNMGTGTLTVLDSTIFNNTASNLGGGIFNDSSSTAILTNSTFSGNQANSSGGGINNSGTLTINNSTIALNNANGLTGGVFNSGTTNINNTIVAGNTDLFGVPDVSGTFVSNSSNVIGDASGNASFSSDTTGVAVGTVINTTLADNGGTTQTHALVAGSSPAIDAGNNANVPGGITTDQRGTGFDRISSGTVDIGAYEIQIPPDIAISSPTIAATSVLIGTTDHVLYQLDLAVTTSNAKFTGATFTTGGSYIAADIVPNSFELFYSTDNIFDAGDTSLGTQAVVTSGSNLAFTGLSQTINSGTTGTLFLVADIAAGATAGNTINIAAPMLSDITFSSGNKTGTPTAGGAQTFAPNLVISEIMFNPNSVEDDWEWVEIYNPGSSTVDLSGYVLDDINTLAHGSANIASGTIAAGQTAILFNDDDLDISNFEAAWGTGINLIGVTGWGNIGLNNPGDTVSLWDSFASYSGDHTTHANAIDTVDYTTGFPTPTDASIYLTNLSADNSNGTNWGTSTDGGITPAGNGYTSANAGGNSGSDIGSPGGSLPVIAISSPTIAAANVLQGTTNHPLYQLDLAVTTDNTQLTGASFTTGGTYIAADIVPNSFELFYSTDTTFDAGDFSLGTQAVVTSGNNLAFTGLSQTINSGTTGTLFLVADIAAGATPGNNINIAAPTLSDITFTAGKKTGTHTASGLQTFDAIPTITSINSGTSNGAFGVGGNVNVTVNFSENVTLAGGNLTVNLDTGGVVNISPFANSNTASGTYTVGAGQNSADLNSTGLVLAGGAMLQDGTGNNVTLTIPGGQSLADNKDIIIDTTPPGAPSTPDMTDASDTGSSNSDNITSDTTPSFTGTAAANSTVTLISDVNGTIGTTTADGSGNWTMTSSSLNEGVHNITATATDAVGNVSPASSALGITIDTTAPSSPSTPDMTAASDTGSSNTDNITSDATPSFTGTAAANSTVTLTSNVNGTIGTTTADGAGNWSITASSLNEGGHNITATATDAAGNVSSASSILAITIDTGVPAAPSVPDMTAATDTGSSNSDNITNNTTPTFIGTAEANSTVTLTSSVNGNIGTTTADGAGNWTLSASSLSQGNHNITATATDGGGNSSPASPALGITIDTTAPTVTINQGGSQADPTAAAPIDFTVLFNEPVTDFITGDVTLGGTASGTLTGTVSETAPNDGTTYNVAVSGMTGNGTVIASLGAGVAVDVAGNANVASTSTDNTVTFNANSAPVLDLNGGASGIDYSETFIRGGGEVAIVDSANLAVTDDGANLTGATVTITNLQDGANEVLTSDISGTSISSSYNSATGVLTLSGSDSLANYQQVLRTVKYDNTFVTPNTIARTIEFLVNDGSVNSTTATTTLNITSATPINVGTVSGPTFAPIASVSDSQPDNIYNLTLGATSRLVVELVTPFGNTDLALYNSSGVLLASSTNSGTTSERIDQSSLTAGNYLVRVSQGSPGVAVDYLLRLNVA